MKEIGEYYLGLDIGTNSVGWAVTDPSYNILEYRHKAMWGIHLFDEGQTAAKRRSYRCNRRRLDRRNQRVRLLRELFNDKISQIDPSFFERLDQSGLQIYDRNSKQPNSLFFDEGFTDKEYFDRFPTIYHLRRYLIDCNDRPDLRLIYLAISHIIKNRGHFLFAGIIDENKDLKTPAFSDVYGLLTEDLTKYGLDVSISNPDKISMIILDRSKSASERRRDLEELLPSETKEDQAKIKALSGLLSGSKVKLSSLFDDKSIDESLSMSDAGIEDKLAEMENTLTDDQIVTLRLIKQLYDWSILANIMAGFDHISDAKIQSYEEHKKDLSDLKNALKKDKSLYQKMFKSLTEQNNYCNYTGMFPHKGKKGSNNSIKKCSKDEFYKCCKSMLQNRSDELANKILRRMDEGVFMPKQSTTDNSVLPYTVHLEELRSILSNVSKWYTFLNEIQEDGYTISEKIEMVMKFRVPYYVGPLNSTSPNSWAVRVSDYPIRPWNFDKIVDLDASAERFIDRMTSVCTYIIGEKVLPKNSILYSYFSLYNELNNLRIDGNKLDVGLKRAIVRNLFENSDKKVTEKSILKYLKNSGMIDDIESVKISGMDKDIKTTLKPIHQIGSIIRDKGKDRKLTESIIRILTVFSDQKRKSAVLSKDYGKILSTSEISKLSRIDLNGWGRLSERFLTGIFDTCHETGTTMNIIGMMENTQDNLMEILHKYSFLEQIEEINRDISGTSDNNLNYSDLEELNLPPAVKRGTWRSVQVVSDIISCAGHLPTKIFVETTRDHVDKNDRKQTVSRKRTLNDLYLKCKEDSQWISSLDSQSDENLKSRSLYLYYTQLGKCMYCGGNIDLESVNNKDLYNLDHIYPQSRIKDDSIHKNMVLCHTQCNMNKRDVYPVSLDVQNKMRPTWKMLLDKGYISSEKYDRLTRTEPFTEDELDRFISRQLVETSQSVKAIISLLKRLSPSSEIIYVKASTVSEFRHDNGLLKCRSVNDFHHAKDAYLNIVVGNVYDTKFTRDIRAFIRTRQDYNLRKVFDSPVSRNDKDAWIPGEDGSIKIVKKYMRRNNILYVRRPFVAKGALFDDNIISKYYVKENIHFPKKTGRKISDYGGYSDVKGACFSLVEYESKGQIIRSLEFLPVMLANSIDNDRIESFFKSKLSEKAKVVIPIVRMDSLLDWGGFKLHISGRTGDNIICHSAVQLLMPDELYLYCREINKISEDRKNRIIHDVSYYRIDRDKNLNLFSYLMSKFKSDPYSKMPGTLKSNLESVHKKFEESDEMTQAKILNEVLLSFQCNAATANLLEIGGIAHAGLIKPHKKLPKDIPIMLINQSPSGLRSNSVRLNP